MGTKILLHAVGRHKNRLWSTKKGLCLVRLAFCSTLTLFCRKLDSSTSKL
uniref:Uncharacterized protein n=1 Tax=Arundo donax TaxID=35708 RepID=A0A0A8ZZC9_ARUDO